MEDTPEVRAEGDGNGARHDLFVGSTTIGTRCTVHIDRLEQIRSPDVFRLVMWLGPPLFGSYAVIGRIVPEQCELAFKLFFSRVALHRIGHFTLT